MSLASYQLLHSAILTSLVTSYSPAGVTPRDPKLLGFRPKPRQARIKLPGQMFAA